MPDRSFLEDELFFCGEFRLAKTNQVLMVPKGLAHFGANAMYAAAVLIDVVKDAGAEQTRLVLQLDADFSRHRLDFFLDFL